MAKNYGSLDIADDFVETSELIQKKIKQYTTKREKLAYLASIKDFVNSSMKLTRAYMKGLS